MLIFNDKIPKLKYKINTKYTAIHFEMQKGQFWRESV
jgi:hypothetical protein